MSRTELAEVERALLRIRRSQSRRTVGRLALRELGPFANLRHVEVIIAVEEGSEGPGREVTVGLVGERLGLDPSRASRGVADAIRAGLVRRVASQVDGRRIRLELTESGQELAKASHGFRRAFYDRLMEGWSEAERAEFARLLGRFADRIEEVGAR